MAEGSGSTHDGDIGRAWLVEVHPATADRFDDVAAVLRPRDDGAQACWCLAYRLGNAENRQPSGAARPERLREACAQEPAPGVVATVDGVPAGWCSFGPRAELPRLARSRTIPVVDEAEVWSVFCLVVRAGHRRAGISRRLLDGAVRYARTRGVSVLEGYPVDTGGARISATLAFVGTTSLFEAAGFRRVVITSSTAGGQPRWLVRRSL